MNATINNSSETKIKNLELRTTSNELRETINDKKKKTERFSLGLMIQLKLIVWEKKTETTPKKFI